MESLHLVQLVLQLLVRVLQELGLCLELLLDVFVDVLLLSLGVNHVRVQVLVETQFKLVVVVDELRHVVHGLAIGLDRGVVLKNLRARLLNLFGHPLLAATVVVNREAQSRVELVEVLQPAIKRECLLLQLLDLILLRSDVALQILDFEVKHKFEFLQLLGLLFQLVDLGLPHGNVVVLLVDLRVLLVDLLSQVLAVLVLFLVLKIFVLNLSLQLINLILDVAEFVLSQLQLSL